MPFIGLRFICLTAALAGSMVWADPSRSAFPDTSSFAAELHLLEGVAAEGNIQQVAASLPPSWMVNADGQQYLISTAPLRNLTGSPEQARIWLHQLALQIESYSSASAAPSDSRARLSAILSRREFDAAKPPGPLELLYEAIGLWIRDFFRRILAFAERHPAGAEVLFWLGALAATGLVGLWLFQLWTGRSRIVRAEPAPPLQEATWQRWVLMAQEARDRGDLREAIHCIYRAAVVHLHSLRSLPEDRSRTPREFLRLLEAHDSLCKPLAALTFALERFWYANRPVSPDDLRESFELLQALGCGLT